MAFVDGFADMMPDTLLAQPGTTDNYGEWVASGEEQSITCRFEGRSRLVRDSSGREVVSMLQAITLGVFNLTVAGYRYTLPARFTNRTEVLAIGVERESDEDGPDHEVVLFP
jgi:hypothetical protein